MNPIESDTTDLTEIHRALWHVKASSQGLVCLVCRRVPCLERRAAFFDTGLCMVCDADLDETPDAS